MIDYEEALRLVLEHAGPRGTETVPVAAAAGRVLAEDVAARIPSPPFDKAAMDGYAVRAQDVQRLSAELEVIGQAFAGEPSRLTIGPGQACVITTGAPVPPGADTVVMVEHTEQAGAGRVRILKLTGANICPEGEDARAGQVLLRAGAVMTPLRIGVAATAGAAQVRVYRLPSAALLCTGSGSRSPVRRRDRAASTTRTAPCSPRCSRPSAASAATWASSPMTRGSWRRACAGGSPPTCW